MVEANPSGIDAARTIVQSILDQITLHDSPPINDQVPQLPTPSRSKTRQEGNLSNESLTSDPPENETAVQWMTQYKQRLSTAEMKMGHCALATLCHTTLENVNNSTRVPADENTAPQLRPTLTVDTAGPVDLLHETHRHESPLIPLSPLMERDPPALEYTAHALSGQGNNNLPTPTPRKETDSLWDGHEERSRDPPETIRRDPSPSFVRNEHLDGEFEETLVSIVQSLSLGDSSSVEEQEDPSHEFDKPRDSIHLERISALTAPRYQMYGSEYARFLSETPFSPDRKQAMSIHNKHKKGRNSLPPIRPTNGKVYSLPDGVRIYNLEEADSSIAVGAITDIIILDNETVPPKGYFRVAEGRFCVKKEPSWDRAAQRPCVTALAVIFPDRQEVVPPGFCVVSVYEGGGKATKAANLNTNGERIYICYRRSREGNPLTGLLPLMPSKNEAIPEGYTVLERSPRNHVANINSGSGEAIFISFRQRLASLEPLRPLPLLLSVFSDSMKNKKPQQQAIFRKVTLKSYYCTGGTTVTANIGRFHIMDRSTHALLSPSSIKNRLSLIQASRLKSGGSVDGSTLSSQVDESAYSLQNTLSGGSHSLLEGESFVDSHLEMRESEDERLDSVYHSDSTDDTRKEKSSTLFSQGDAALRICLKAMNFIPVVETPPREEPLETQLALEARIAMITPILTACYTHHGGCAILAVNGLSALLNDTDFFRPDLVVYPDGEGSDARLTLLDISIQSVCDIATSTVRETSFVQCIDFVKTAVRYAEGHLNTRTIGYVLRFYLFVFYFGASVPTTSSAPNTVWKSPEPYESTTRSVVGFADVPFLHEMDNSAYLPGGAPQAAVLALKELVSLLLNRIVVLSYAERMRILKEVKTVSFEAGAEHDPLGSFIDGLMGSLVDNAIRRVDLANYTQLALVQIHRSGGSELFWYDMMTSCGVGMFGGIEKLPNEAKSVYMITFSLLANMVKVSSGKIRRDASTGVLVLRDVASKLLSLEVLNHFFTCLQTCVEKENLLDGPNTIEYQRESAETLIYAMRRLVVPCLLSNTVQGLQDARVFRRLMHILSNVWRSSIYRTRMKFEIGVLVEHFAIRVLNLGPQLLTIAEMQQVAFRGMESPPKLDSTISIFQEPMYNQQIDLLFEINKWFQQDPRGVLEFFLNFDTDISLQNEGPNHWMPGSQWKLCEQLCGSVCLISQQCSNIIANQIKDSIATNEGPLTPTGSSSVSYDFDFNPTNRNEKTADQVRLAVRQLQSAGFKAVAQLARGLAVAAATSAGEKEAALFEKHLPISERASIEFEDDGYIKWSDGFSASSESRDAGGDDTILSYWRTAIAAERGNNSVRRHAESKFLISDNTSLDGCETSMASHGGTFDTAADEVLRDAFEIIETKNLKKGIEYLIENNYVSPSARDIATFLRIHRNRLDSKKLGIYLGECGNTGAEIEHWNQIRFNYVRAISFVGMTVEQGLRHFLTNCGFRLPGEAQQIDRLMTTFSQCYWEDNAGDYNQCPFDDQDTVFLLSFAIIMLNTDLHKVPLPTKSRSRSRGKIRKMTKPEFLNNLRDVARGDDLSKEYLSEIYDSVEASPIELFEETTIPLLEISTASGLHSSSNESTTTRDLGKMLKGMLKNVKKSEELLRGISVHEFRFYTIEDYADLLSCNFRDALSELCHSAFVSQWRHFYGLIKSTVKIAHLDPAALVLVLPILRSFICATICLDLDEELSALINMLARVKTFAEKATIVADSYEVEEWFKDLKAALEDSKKIVALEQIDEIMTELEERLQVDSQARKQITRVVRKIRDGQFLLNDPSRVFVKEGHLMKRSHRLGRAATNYHFFLFSDLLVYAKPATVAPGEDLYYTLHEVLSLHLMKVTDWYPNAKKHTDKMLTIHHPRKSFDVVCSTIQERKDWVSVIRQRIHEALRRMALVEEARRTPVDIRHFNTPSCF